VAVADEKALTDERHGPVATSHMAKRTRLRFASRNDVRDRAECSLLPHRSPPDPRGEEAMMFAKANASSLALLFFASIASATGGCADDTASAASALHVPRARPGRNAYEIERLVSDDASIVPAEHQDPALVNAWGLAASPTGPWWVANNGSNTSTLYDGEGNKQALEVSVPGAPTGLVFHSGPGLLVEGHPAFFVFATESGTLSAWAPQLQPNTAAVTVVDDSSNDAIYKGLAIAAVDGSERLYATDFHNAGVDVFDSAWAPVTLSPGAFSDAGIPAGYAPFGIRTLAGMVIVTFAKQDADAEDDVHGPGLGFVDAFDLDGNLLFRVGSRARLNAPWGLALAPDDFGAFGGMLLVGNFGNGHINAFDLSRCQRNGCQDRGELHGESGGALAIDGLWAIDFGKGNTNTGDTDALYFTSGPDDESHGLFGYIEPAE
jgi:uncharacterized protein (TIGR03118 family)